MIRENALGLTFRPIFNAHLRGIYRWRKATRDAGIPAADTHVFQLSTTFNFRGRDNAQFIYNARSCRAGWPVDEHGGSGGTGANLAVIVNAENNFTGDENTKRTQIKRLYLKEQTAWPGASNPYLLAARPARLNRWLLKIRAGHVQL
ncbi:MAG: hypothetical protein Q9M45_09145 [Robiginitomaculum sp.]|nr:hypothetical protein [Robiginitomaculum sp.]